MSTPSSPISTPKGGGAQSGLGEKFSPDLFTGTGNFSVPIALPPGRNGFQPEISLQYSTGSGNGPFGLGWNLSIPGVTRKTDKGIPKYDNEKDVFILSGAEDLVPVEKADNWVRYQPRTEGLFARIYHFLDGENDYWKVMSKDGLVSLYGTPGMKGTDLAVIADPANRNKVFSWRLTRTEDVFGNHILYQYERDTEQSDDYHEWDQNYLKSIKYGDYSLSPFGGTGTGYMVRVEFIYEDRSDAFSGCKSGFEIRTVKRCNEINIYTNPIEGEIHTRSYHFLYHDTVLENGQPMMSVAEQPVNSASLLCRVDVEGHDGDVSEKLPPLDFRYSKFKPQSQKFRKVEGNDLPLASLSSPGYEMIDLFGNGLPDIVEVNGVVRYWRNLGDGRFDMPRIMKEAPTGISLQDPNIQLIDANGDGRTDLLMNTPQISGYFSTTFNASWDTKSFKKYKQAPSFSLSDPEVKLIDLDGDGVTDAIRSGSSFECFFNDKNDGWKEATRVQRNQVERFPNLGFSDLRIKWADMSGDGLQDIVLVHNGNITYWPNMGYGHFGKPVIMKNSPRFGQDFDPSRLLLGDIDGDGQADLVYIDHDKVHFCFNKSGNSWSDAQVIAGTPAVADIRGVRIADIMGTGVSGLLYSFDAITLPSRPRWYFLDFTGGTKPYLLHEMDNNMGSLTRVSYLPSIRHYLADQLGKSPFNMEGAGDYTRRKPWKTTLPFPVQVVSRVEVIDKISKGKLTTEYLYHHGYWDGGEREFRGFGRVDQRDTETFEVYNSPGLHDLDSLSSAEVGGVTIPPLGEPGEDAFNAVAIEHYSPPTETRNWFHLGPIGDEFGDWKEVNFTDEYWSEDPSILEREQETKDMLKTLPRRAKRDALRVLRGGSLRTELYALTTQQNGVYVSGRPYTVSETQYGLKDLSPTSLVIASAAKQSHYIFFSFSFCSRTTQWERGNDPMTQLSFSGDFDQYGQARRQLSVALPRGIMSPYTSTNSPYLPEDGGGSLLSTFSYTTYAQKDTISLPLGEGQGGVYMVDRVCRSLNFEVIPQNENAFQLKGRIFGLDFENNNPIAAETQIGKIIGCSFNYYDGTAFEGMPYGQLGDYGAVVKSETLIITQAIIDEAYGNDVPECFKDIPDWSESNGYPVGFEDALQGVTPEQKQHLGYLPHDNADEPAYPSGWYAPGGKTKYDFHDDVTTANGLVVETQDAFENKATVIYDDYKLMPLEARQYIDDDNYLATVAQYDYRVLQAKMITDPNLNRSVFDFSPLGLMKQSGVIGKEGAGEGDIKSETVGLIPLDYEPSVRMEYDFLCYYNSGQPVWVKTIQREQHWTDVEDSPTIIKVEYTDGFGRLLQTRTQAEDVIFGDSLFGDSGLPEDQTMNADAVGIERGPNDPLNVVVSGWQVYNNKGKAVEKYEPFFDKGFNYNYPFDDATLQSAMLGGVKVRMFYDPRGQVVKTINPDDTMQLVLFGKPVNISDPPLHEYELPEPEVFTPTPWESYSYDANDLAPKTHSGEALAGSGVLAPHYFTPKSSTLDALGRTVKTIDRLSTQASDEVVMNYQYDIRGNLLKVNDAYDRLVFDHTYDLRPKQKNEKGEEQPLTPLKTFHIDKGIDNLLSDSASKPLIAYDAKGANTLTAYDNLNRPFRIWAKDKSGEVIILRQKLVYGDDLSDGPISPETTYHLGKLYKHYDEAGLITFEVYDFKGNILEKKREVIADSEILSVFSPPPTDWVVECFKTDWDNAPSLEGEYTANMEYDAMNRITKLIYPEDLDTERKELEPVYNNAGSLEKVTLDGESYVEHIAYNAKGQRLMIAFGNDVMTRYTYDADTFRLTRQRSEGYTKTDWTFETAGTVHQDSGYEYDLAGNIIKIKERITNCGVGGTNSLDRVFNYDPLYRLLKATGRENSPSITPIWDDSYRSNDNNITTAYTQNYQYDKMGNIQQLQHIGNNNFTRNFDYDIDKNTLQEINIGIEDYSFTYDENGNQITQNTERHFEWNNLDKMRSFFIQTGTSEPTKYAHYLYDSEGNRIKKIIRTSGGDYTSIIYIGGIFEYKTNGTDAQNNLHIMDSKSRISTLRIGDDFGDTTPEIKYIIEDHLTNSTSELDNNGTLIEKEEYYPFGETSFGSYSKKRYRYCGKERDEESNLYYYGARYYLPWTCRFINIDPLANDYAQLTPYNYAGNMPITHKDLDGLQGTGNTKAVQPTTAGSTGNISATVYIRPITDGTLDSQQMTSFQTYVKDNIDTIIGGQTFNSVSGGSVTTNTAGVNVIILGAGVTPSLGPNQVLFDVGIGGRPFVSGNQGYLDFNQMGSNMAAHEFAHTMGLSDRYNYWQKVSDVRVQTTWTSVSMSLDATIDPQYVGNENNNLMSIGSILTDTQWNIMFSSSVETNYPQYTFYSNDIGRNNQTWGAATGGATLGLNSKGEIISSFSGAANIFGTRYYNPLTGSGGQGGVDLWDYSGQRSANGATINQTNMMLPYNSGPTAP